MVCNVSPQEPIPSAFSLTPEQAKAKVLEHWNHLDALPRRRFPKSENLAHEALLYVLGHLEAGAWRRVRAWQRLGHFLPRVGTAQEHLR
jgi:hypothetical protein